MDRNISEEFLNEQNNAYINRFQCVDKDGDNQVETFLQQEAFKLMQRNLVRTRLFFDGDQNLIGFYSLFNETIKMNKQKREEVQIYLPQKVKEIPAIRLHYIGVDSRYQNQGIGLYIMSSVLTNCTKVAKLSGCSLITVESTENTVNFYSKFDFKYLRPAGDYKLMAMNTKNLLNLVN
ncbi:GNAT family N-acetyltransferase [Lentibacillus sp. CBA3610]|uniref:GNAT family N-acetyltransferase n=1 Tax=Lentibacillus sp. CBA3610 TaxID=2518176 RepID=UPI00159638F4|nr:GNAT family N-acetyltransferase [Lentibacillus sp. CBA3610]QKY70399.1 GNAT family N-acetyltransferase [Lentibacillus sp. CBA3610]